MAYRAQQGILILVYPVKKFYYVNRKHCGKYCANLADTISKENKIDVTVKAYEGPDKGAYGVAAYVPMIKNKRMIIDN